MNEAPDLTQLLHAWNQGNTDARAALMQLVYERIHGIAQKALRAAPNATLTPTELSNESLMRLLQAAPEFVDRQHFFSVVALASRQILVDAARKRMSEKYGGQQIRSDWTEQDHIAAEQDQLLIRLDAAISDLGKSNPRQGEVLQLAYFGGFGQQEIADFMKLSLGTIERDLRFARAWLKQAIEE